MQISSKKSGPTRVNKQSDASHFADEPINKDRYFTDEEILEAMRGRYREYENKRLFEALKQLVEALSEPHPDGFFMHKDPRHLDTLFELSTKTTFKEKDSQNRWVFETDTGASLHVKHGEISYEKAVLRTVGKNQRKVYKPFSEQDALNIALAAMHDRSMLPPNKVHISNATYQQRKDLQLAFAYVSMKFMPEGEEFLMDNPVPHLPANLEKKFGHYLYHIQDRQKFDAPIHEQNENEKNLQESVQKNSDEFENVYATTKNLLLDKLGSAEDYTGSSVLALIKDVAQELKIDDLDIREAQSLIAKLKEDGIVSTEKSQGTEIIKTINFMAINPYPEVIEPEAEPPVGGYVSRVYDRNKFNKIAEKVVTKPGDYIGKDQDGFFKAIRLKIKDEDKKALWDQLIEEKIVILEDGKVSKVLETLKGTRAGDELNSLKQAQEIKRQIKDNIAETKMELNDSPDFKKAIIDVIENRQDWIGKQRKDVLAFLDKGATDKEGIAIWEGLKEKGYIALSNNRIVATASNLKGTKYVEQLKRELQEDMAPASETTSPEPKPEPPTPPSGAPPSKLKELMNRAALMSGKKLEEASTISRDGLKHTWQQVTTATGELTEKTLAGAKIGLGRELSSVADAARSLANKIPRPKRKSRNPTEPQSGPDAGTQPA